MAHYDFLFANVPLLFRFFYTLGSYTFYWTPKYISTCSSALCRLFLLCSSFLGFIREVLVFCVSRLFSGASCEGSGAHCVFLATWNRTENEMNLCFHFFIYLFPSEQLNRTTYPCIGECHKSTSCSDLCAVIVVFSVRWDFLLKLSSLSLPVPNHKRHPGLDLSCRLDKITLIPEVHKQTLRGNPWGLVEKSCIVSVTWQDFGNTWRKMGREVN